MDTRIPHAQVRGAEERPVYGYGSDRNACWVQLFEKAYAKLAGRWPDHGCYEAHRDDAPCLLLSLGRKGAQLSTRHLQRIDRQEGVPKAPLPTAAPVLAIAATASRAENARAPLHSRSHGGRQGRRRRCAAVLR